jgi:hypothetical protein
MVVHVQTKDEDRLEWLRGAASARVAALATSSGIYLIVMKIKMSIRKLEVRELIYGKGNLRATYTPPLRV